MASDGGFARPRRAALSSLHPSRATAQAAHSRRCRRCGQLRRHAAHGLCNACYQRDPLIVGVWVQGAQDRLGERCPEWFGAFADWLLERSAPAVCLRHCAAGAALTPGSSDPSR